MPADTAARSSSNGALQKFRLPRGHLRGNPRASVKLLGTCRRDLRRGRLWCFMKENGCLGAAGLYGKKAFRGFPEAFSPRTLTSVSYTSVRS